MSARFSCTWHSNCCVLLSYKSGHGGVGRSPSSPPFAGQFSSCPIFAPRQVKVNDHLTLVSTVRWRVCRRSDVPLIIELEMYHVGPPRGSSDSWLGTPGPTSPACKLQEISVLVRLRPGRQTGTYPLLPGCVRKMCPVVAGTYLWCIKPGRLAAHFHSGELMRNRGVPNGT